MRLPAGTWHVGITVSPARLCGIRAKGSDGAIASGRFGRSLVLCWRGAWGCMHGSCCGVLMQSQNLHFQTRTHTVCARGATCQGTDCPGPRALAHTHTKGWIMDCRLVGWVRFICHRFVASVAVVSANARAAASLYIYTLFGWPSGRPANAEHARTRSRTRAHARTVAHGLHVTPRYVVAR